VAQKVPQFPLMALLQHRLADGTVFVEEEVPCQLRVVPHAVLQMPIVPGEYVGQTQLCNIYFPIGTDVRGPVQAIKPDFVSIPPVGGSLYLIRDVAYVAKGFPNEFVSAQAHLVSGGGPGE